MKTDRELLQDALKLVAKYHARETILVDWEKSVIEAINARLNDLESSDELISRLRMAMHDIYEVYAGSEGFIPQTCPEAYLQERMKEMAYIAGKHKSIIEHRINGEEE